MCYHKVRPRPPPNIGLKSPSHEGIQVQHRISETRKKRLREVSVNNRLVRSYALFQPIKKSPLKTDPSDASEEDYDSDATIILPITETPVSNEKMIACSVKTITFGIRKHATSKKVRYYWCISCKERFTKLSLLNTHFKDKHPPL